jgi:hypothetical protein
MNSRARPSLVACPVRSDDPRSSNCCGSDGSSVRVLRCGSVVLTERAVSELVAEISCSAVVNEPRAFCKNQANPPAVSLAEDREALHATVPSIGAEPRVGLGALKTSLVALAISASSRLSATQVTSTRTTERSRVGSTRSVAIEAAFDNINRPARVPLRACVRQLCWSPDGRQKQSLQTEHHRRGGHPQRALCADERSANRANSRNMSLNTHYGIRGHEQSSLTPKRSHCSTAPLLQK